MAIIKCKMCGGDMVLNEEKTFGTCEYCGSTMTLPKVSDDQRAARFNRGNHFRRQGEFDKALAVYESIVREDDNDAEAHWCCALCRFGIEYVEDPNTLEYLPTCHRASFDSFLEDVDYLAALEHSDGITRRQYQKDAAKIAEVQKGILATSQNEEPFDVFICYKETDDDTKERTRDSLDAQEIYYQLTQEGYRVFFSRITLEDKVGTEYEPYIFAALNSAKVMVAIGSKPEYFNAVWVKNEWSRFLAMMRKDRSKLLLPCYKGMDPYDLPEQLGVLQSYDMSKIGFMQDLIRGIKKVLRKDEPKPEAQAAQPQVVVRESGSGPNVTALLKRGNMALEDKGWEKAKEYFDQVLNMDAENYDAYLGLAMVEARTATKTDFQAAYIDRRVNENGALRRAKQFADSEQAAWWSSMERRKRQEEEAAKERLKQLRKKLASAQSFLSAGLRHTVGLKSDGTVAATKYTGDQKDYYGQCDVSGWRDIVAVSAGDFHTVGLKSDGTVVATKYTGDQKDYHGQCDVSGWRDIVAVSAGGYHTVGLKADGTVVAVGSNYFGQCGVSGWMDIVAVSAGGRHTVGLKSDGTVVAVGDNTTPSACNVSGWRDVVAVSAGSSHTVGLKADGTVVAEGYNGDGQCDVSGWTDIVAVSAGSSHTVGLKADGTVVATKYTGDQKYYNGQCNVSGWRDIVAVSAGGYHTVGLKADGTVVAVGCNVYGECDVSGWRLFNHFETLDQERKEAAERAERERIAAEQRRKEENDRKCREISGKIVAAQQRQAAAQAELANLKGLFTGKRRKELEAEIASLDRQLAELQKQLDAIRD